MKTYRTAIIGTGGIAKAHVDGIREQGDRVELVAAMDQDPDRVNAFCKAHSIPHSYTNLDRLLNVEKPDYVHIATPPGTHCELTVRCLEAGAWVLCEKPLCASLSEMDRIEATETRTGGYCASVFQWRYGSGAQHFKALLEGGTLGKPLVGLCSTTWFRDAAYYAVPWRGKWKTELGGPTMGHGIHAMDSFLWLMGEWQEVRAMMGTLDRDIEVEDVSMAIVRFQNGAMASIINSILCPRQESLLRFDLQNATVEAHGLYSFPNDAWTYTPKDGVDEATVANWRTFNSDTPTSHGTQLTAFLASMDAKTRPLTSGDQARNTIEFLSALYKAAVTGETVPKSSIGPDDPFYYSLNGQE